MMRLLAAIVLVAATSVHADDRLDRAIDAVMAAAEKAMRDRLVPGLAVAIVSREGAAVVRGYGTRRVGAEEPVGPDTAFQLASLSKPIASTVIARLVGA
jgi:CubicO group peptidase (beta-lactamase class C family)